MSEIAAFVTGVVIGVSLSVLCMLISWYFSTRNRLKKKMRRQRAEEAKLREKARSSLLESLDILLARFAATAEIARNARKRSEVLLLPDKGDTPA